MGSRSDCFCWEIMRCDKSNCPARQNPAKNCWEIAMEKDNDYRNVFNVCRDCIVHVLKSDTSVLSNLEIQKILDAKINHSLPSAQTLKSSRTSNVIAPQL